MSNTTPQAFPVSVTINENGEVEIRVFFQDFDLGDTHNLEIHVGDMLGTSTVIDEETFRYDPGTAFDYLKPGETATDTFSYTVTDSAGATATETVTITLTGKNDGPVAVSVTAQTDEDTPITIAPDFSDADAGDSHALTVDTEGTKGTVIVNEDGTFTYDPNGAFDELGKGESTVDTFTYTVTDASGATSTETVTVTINGLDENNPPITYPVELDAVEDGKIAFRVIFEDQDIGDTHTYEVDKDVLKGSLTEVGDRLFHYEPGVAFDYLAEGETATDTFTYTVTDNSGASHTSTVIITVTGKNDAPVASSVDVSTSESSSVVITPDFSDADTNDSHTITVETDGTLGSVTVNDDGTFTYDPNGQFDDLDRGQSATDSFTYTVTDEMGVSSTQTVVVTVNGESEVTIQPGKIRASDGTESDVFGLASQINDHGVIVVGAYGDDDKGNGSGSVYIYTPDGNGWFSEAKLVASDGAANDRFGSVTAINNSGVVAVGATRDDDGTGNYFGSVYAYIPTDGGSYKEVKLTADVGVKYDYLGEDLVINDAGVIVASAFGSTDDRIIVFTPDEEGGYTQESLSVPGNGAHSNRGVHINEDGVISVGGLGSVTIFTPNGEGGYSELVLSAPDSNSSFGKHVAVESDGTVIVGGSNAIFVYEPDGEGNYSISKFDAEAGSSFAVSADGTIVVGHASSNSNGAVQVYAPDGDGGYTRYDLSAYDGAANDYFGYSVSIADDGTITVGAYGDDDKGGNSGSVYVFTRNEDGSYTGPDGTIYEAAGPVDILTYGEYVEPQGDATAGKIRAFDGTESDVFGLASQINDHGVIVVSAHGDDDKANGSGSVYIYTPDGNGWFSETKLVASDGAASDRFGSVTAINNSGVVAVGATRDDDGTSNYFGSVYAYIPTDGGSYKEVKLTADVGVKYDYLGEDLVINDAGVIVASAFGSASDRIIVFTPDGEGGYTQESLSVPGNGAHSNRGVHINEDGVISVGGLGSVTIFTPNGEGGYSELVLSAPDSNSSFGKHVAVESDGTVIVGGSNAIFVYEPDGEGNYSISKFDAEAGSSFAVSADGTIVVGHASSNSNGAVQVYAPDGDGGYTRYDLSAYDGAANDYFGYSVSIADDGTITVGAYGDNDKGSNSGSVYVFTRNEDGSYTGPDGTIYEAAGTAEVSDLGLAAMELKGSEASDMLQGGDLADIINGNGGDDVIDGGAGDDILTGGEGKDTFVFASGEVGHDTINDFSASEGLIDVVKFETSLFGDFDAVLASAEQVGADAVITINEDTSITLKDVSLSDLHADDFAFV
ncbi:Ig-like domain-containing protein [Pseudovibrio ascidiaceicola]|uniref:Ig-like domain-containing protein n=1 Tax=Pseudovibrio ascidiaceicola TaxID=285279 RepID=UPI000D68FC62|nr:VCBS domain-containing protein [Pseudovibrio ascidiaceicola]